MIVLDTSVAIAWTFSDERTDAVLAVLNRTFAEGVCVPCHWHVEIANVFRSAIRTKRASTLERAGYLADLRTMLIEVDAETAERAWTETVQLSDRHDLTIYDAAYLELALRRRLPLATLDKQLIAAARAENFPVLP